MARMYFLLFSLFCFILPTLQSVRHGFPPDSLFVEMNDEMHLENKVRAINVNNEFEFNQLIRSKRNVKILPAAAGGDADVTKSATTIPTSTSKTRTTNTLAKQMGSSDSLQNNKNITTMVSTRSKQNKIKKRCLYVPKFYLSIFV